MLSFINKYRIQIAFNIILIIGYVAFILGTGYPKDIAQITFWAPDSQAYRDVGDWIFGVRSMGWENLGARPFLYPVLLNLARSIGGLYGIWGMQFIMWLVIANCVGFCVWKLTRNPFLVGLATLIFVSNISLLLLTLHGLTEITASFLLSLYALVVVINRKNIFSTRVAPILLLICSCMAVVRPVFVPFVALATIIVILFWAWKRVRISAWIFLFLALFPIAIQMSLFKFHFGSWEVSGIGRNTLYDYYFSRVYAKVNEIDVLNARKQVERFSKKDILSYCLLHREVAIKTYLNNFRDNILSCSDFANAGEKRPILKWVLKKENRVYMFLHVIMVFPLFFHLIRWVKRKEWDQMILVLAFAVPMGMIFFSSPISFNQGDRLVLPAIPLWVILYAFLMSKMLEKKSI